MGATEKRMSSGRIILCGLLGFGLAFAGNVPYEPLKMQADRAGAPETRMKPKERIEAFLRAELDKELALTDPRVRFIAARAQELYWTLSRLLGLSRLHDGRWRKPSDAKARSLRPVLEGEIPPPASKGRLLIDVTATHRYQKQTGVQRVVREIARACVESGSGVPVYIEDGRLFSHFKHARLPYEIEFNDGDRFLLLDSGWGFYEEYPPLLEAARRAGAGTIGCLYDIIPVLYPAATELANGRSFVAWLENVLMKCDALICISKSVADDFIDYLRETGRPAPKDMQIGWWPLGADFRAPPNAAPSTCASGIASASTPFFMSVGTLEPRKAYPVALTAFEKLWADGRDLRYVIVGRPGWNTRALQRRIRTHPEFGRRLFWLDDASDADLFHLYGHARALVFPSFAEGFGMPLVEAAHHRAPVIASDIPVFREIGGEDVIYFPLLDADALAARICEALSSAKTARLPDVVSWRESAAMLSQMLRDDKYQINSTTLQLRIGEAAIV